MHARVLANSAKQNKQKTNTQVAKLTSATLDLYHVLLSTEPTDDADLLAALDERMVLSMLFRWGKITYDDQFKKGVFKKLEGCFADGDTVLFTCSYLKADVPGTRAFSEKMLREAA